ncbi:Hypothetical predicted protein [Pelobates cultripes]|uniref:Uncharacterized protein n=1 Tax=Pelobates cultripes TaxID=61616 RepID=A0AAD1TFA9_PELCU|nr:Hypothetical predicted protein [Pelobates cultripes]
MADGTHASALHEAKRDTELRLPPSLGPSQRASRKTQYERLQREAWHALQAPIPGPTSSQENPPPLAETRSLTKGNHSQTKPKHIGDIPVQQQRRSQPRRPAVTQLKRGSGNPMHTNKRWTTRPTKETATVRRHGYGYSLRTHSQVRPNTRATVYSQTDAGPS